MEMSKSYERYVIGKPSVSMRNYDKYVVKTPSSVTDIQEESGDSWPSLIGKSVLKGASSLLDIPKLVGRGIEGVINSGTKLGAHTLGQLHTGWDMSEPNRDVSELDVDK